MVARPNTPPLSAAEVAARLLYRDGLMLIIDKPAGLPVHAGPGGGPNVEQAFEHLQFGLREAPALAHRLDRDTSGCLVLGRHRKALRKLGQLFAAGRVEKIYWAITVGAPADPEGRIEAPLAKFNRKFGWKMIVDPSGQPAITDYRVRGTSEGLAWIEFRPRTGRTHQIRVHAAHLGCPVLGDPVYGADSSPVQPLHLHARAVSVPLYPKRDPITAVAPPPPHMIAALSACGWSGE